MSAIVLAAAWIAASVLFAIRLARRLGAHNHEPRAVKLLPSAATRRLCCCTEAHGTAQLYRYGDRWSTTVCARCAQPFRDEIAEQTAGRYVQPAPRPVAPRRSERPPP